jgi:DNA-binding NarL/FixJ family response regulator
MTVDQITAERDALAEEVKRLRSPINRLTDRQKEVLRLVGRGMQSKEIGRVLGISHETVRDHRLAILGRLGATNAVQAARMAWDAGLL